jgi:hypothetical protein
MNLTKGATMFKKFSTVFGATAIVLGIMMAAGSAGDCDGKCMEQANDLATMLVLAGTGVVFMLAGAFFILVGESK